MATLTNSELIALNFGYLTGQDLVNWCSPMLLIKQYEVNSNSLSNGCSQAYSEAINYFSTKYDVRAELQVVSGREFSFAKLVSILAVRNILGNMAGIGDVTKMAYDWADNIIHQTQSGLFTFALHPVDILTRSGSFLVPQNFSTIG